MSELLVPAPLWRRLSAAAYDGMLLLAVWMIAALADLWIRNAMSLEYDPRVFRAYLFLIGLVFFGWFWTHGGQTLGMRAWRLQLRRTDGQPLRWSVACTRYAFAWLAWLPLGLGVLWCAIDPRGRAWQDMLSNTEMVLLPQTSVRGE